MRFILMMILSITYGASYATSDETRLPYLTLLLQRNKLPA